MLTVMLRAETFTWVDRWIFSTNLNTHEVLVDTCKYQLNKKLAKASMCDVLEKRILRWAESSLYSIPFGFLHLIGQKNSASFFCPRGSEWWETHTFGNALVIQHTCSSSPSLTYMWSEDLRLLATGISRNKTIFGLCLYSASVCFSSASLIY